MPTLRQKLLAKVLHLYPFYSGCGSIANQVFVRWLAGQSVERAWALAGGGKILCPLDDYVGRAVFYVGDLDRKLSWLCKRLIGPGDTVLDIGANIGLVTVLMSHLVGPKGKVHAFEPNPRMAGYLEETLRENSLQNVCLHRCALGSEDGSLTLHVPSDNAGAASLIPGRSRLSDASHEVVVRPLDRIVAEQEVGEIRLIKIDVEGFEPEVFRGAGSVLRSTRPPAVIFELNDIGFNPAEHPSFQLLGDAGYGFFAIPRVFFRMRLERFDPFAGKSPQSHDFLAVPKSAYEHTAKCVGAS